MPENKLTSDIDETAESKQFVTFVVENEAFAVEMAPVQEIIRVPEIVQVPKSPPSLLGLANLRGKVLPIINIRSLFGLQDREIDDQSRAIVINMGQPMGFVVDRVSSVLDIEPSKIEDASGIRGTVNTDLLLGVIRDVGQYKMVMILDFNKLIASEFSMTDYNIASKDLKDKHISSDIDEEDSSDERQLVSFELSAEEYAIAIEDVQEIVQIPEHIVRVPNSDSAVMGIMTLRNRILPLVSLRNLFGLEFKAPDEHTRIIVISIGKAQIGIVVDSVNEVLRVLESTIEPIPPILTSDGSMNEITEICRLDNGKRLVSIISSVNLFKHSAVKEAMSTMKDTVEKQVMQDSDELLDDDEEQLVVFRLLKEEYGVPIDSVQEIVRVPEELTKVPKTPDFVEGVINLRGMVLPVIDQRKNFGLPPMQRNDRQRIIVFVIKGVKIGFIVDSVAEVLKVPKSIIEESPRLSSEQSQIFSRVANMQKQKRIIQIIEPSSLLKESEISQLK